MFLLGVGLGFAGPADRIADGVTIAGVDVGGMTPGAAKAALAQRADQQANTPVTFVAGGRTWQIDRERARRARELVEGASTRRWPRAAASASSAASAASA